MNNEVISLRCENPSHRLILLHGWGADADDLIPFGQTIVKSLDKEVELISLRAPNPHPQSGGRQWYSLYPPNWIEVPVAVENLKMRIEELSSPSVPLSKTAIFGFSQGGAMAISSGCSLPLAGVIACSSYPHPNWKPPEKRPPILLAHGQYDEVVPHSASEETVKLLIERSNIEVELESFNGGHEIPSQLFSKFIRVIKYWFN